LGIIYLIAAIAIIASTANKQKVDFGSSAADNPISGMQDCNKSGAMSLSIITIIFALTGAAIYVRPLQICCDAALRQYVHCSGSISGIRCLRVLRDSRTATSHGPNLLPPPRQAPSPPPRPPPAPHPLRAALFQAVFIPLGICNGGGYSKGPRGKDPALDGACRARCLRSEPAYEGGRCPGGGGFLRGGGGCPPACEREASPAGAWAGSAIEAAIMVRARARPARRPAARRG
jgi:hypothetical protein